MWPQNASKKFDDTQVLYSFKGLVLHWTLECRPYSHLEDNGWGWEYIHLLPEKQLTPSASRKSIWSSYRGFATKDFILFGKLNIWEPHCDDASFLVKCACTRLLFNEQFGNLLNLWFMHVYCEPIPRRLGRTYWATDLHNIDFSSWAF